MDQYFETLRHLFEEYGILIVFPILFFENIPFLGYLAPAITLLIFVGFLLASSPSQLITTALVAYIAILIADSLMYALGYYSSGKWKVLKTVNSRANTVLEVISGQPQWLMFFYQFPPYFRMFLPFGLGMSRFPIHKWVLTTLVGSLLYVMTFISLGAVAYHLFNSIDAANSLGKGLTYFITTYAIIYLIILVRQYIVKRRQIETQQKDQSIDRISD